VSSATILILSYHFYPSAEIGARRLTALARYLSHKGFRVVVVSAFEGSGAEHITEAVSGCVPIQVRRPTRRLLGFLVALKRFASKVKPTPVVQAQGAASENSAPEPKSRIGITSRISQLFFRLVYLVDDKKGWALKAARAATAACRKYDVRLIITSGPPYTSSLAGFLASQQLGIPHIADFRDPWVDGVAAAYPERGVELTFLRSLERRVIREAAAVTSTSAAVVELLAARYPDRRNVLHVVRNGYDGVVAPALATTQGRLSILFAGELYLGRDPFPFLCGIESLLERPDVDSSRVEIVFMGKVDTYCDQSLANWTRGKRCASVVTILPRQDAPALASAVSRATVLLNMAQRQPLSIPAKTYEQLSSGREILLLCEDDCESAGLVKGIRGVTQVDPANTRALGEVLFDLYTRHVVECRLVAPPEAQVSQFSRLAANEAFYQIAVACLSPPTST
jgi:hypothetical protein